MKRVKTMNKAYTRKKFLRESPFLLMIMPGFILVLIFNYVPMAGLLLAFQDFNPAKGLFGDQKWIGLENFTFIFSLPGFRQAFINTIIIAFWKIVSLLIVPIIVALLLNEVRSNKIRRFSQTMIYLPYFLSWVILGGVFQDLLSPGTGLINQCISALGLKPIFFLGSNTYFRGTLIMTNVWKEFGFGTVVYLASMTGIDPSYYEAAAMDGANRWKQTRHITLPSIMSIIVLMTVLSLGNVLNAGFDQVFNLYSPTVFESGDIIDTFVYRMGMLDAQYGPATAVGLFKSVVSLIFISSSYFFAYKVADYRVF